MADTPRVVAGVVPGVMGSALSFEGQDVWTDNHWDNLQVLVRNPSLLKWTKNRAAARLIHDVRVSKAVPLVKFSVLGKLTQYLRHHAEFGKPNGTIPCPYDWRESLQTSAATIGANINGIYNWRLDTPLQPRQPRLVFFTHSMGGLLLRVAVAKGLVHPTRLDRIIHIGAPLRGSPAAFGTLYGKTTLPLLREWFSLVHLFATPSVKKNLLECFQSFPSVAELLPPEYVKYIFYDDLIRRNPLEARFLEAKLAAPAKAVHEMLTAATKILVEKNIPVYTIYSRIRDTQNEYNVEAIALPKPGYSILGTLSYPNGDGTVPAASAEGDDTCLKRPIFDVKHAFLCNSEDVVNMIPTMLTSSAGT